ncbi:MAG TPA: VOC family protein [Myxococcota bacterium]|nr:VOC family protein [Myxococcota bacterium]
MLDHVSLQVKSFAKALPFYTEVLAPLGYVPQYVDQIGKSAGFGFKGDAHSWFARGSLWIAEGQPAAKIHLALRSPSREAVAGFYAATLRAGGKDNGKPGLRPDYHASYYAAFVFDLDGNNLEALTHDAA